MILKKKVFSVVDWENVLYDTSDRIPTIFITQSEF